MAVPKIRVLYISSVGLDGPTGGSAVMRNHLQNDFEVLEINDNTLKSYFFRKGVLSRIEQKIKNSRLHYWYLMFRITKIDWLIPRSCINKARDFKPQIVITVAHGDLYWCAIDFARKLRLPLATVFHDWWPLLFDHQNTFPVFFTKFIEKRFLLLHQKSDCSLCISDGMKQALGPNKRSEILYPCTDLHYEGGETVPLKKQGDPFKIIYSGNISGSYGRLLQQLVMTCPHDEAIQLKILGSAHEWDPTIRDLATKKGVLHPLLPHQQFMAEMATADVFLIVLGFDENTAMLMKTNFPSKAATYAKFSKPMLLWGPDYSSGAQFMNIHQAGPVVDVPDPLKVWEQVYNLKNSLELQQFYSNKSVYINRVLLNPELIQQRFIDIITETALK